jgi:PAS domain S-box-containing protein
MGEKKDTVLVVDDESVICIMLRMILEKAGYEVIVADNGTTAIRYAVKYEPDLILLDIMLPDISGYEVYQRIREIEASMLIPVIFVSALEEDTVLEDLARTGQGVDYILKPVREAVLLARVANILDVVRSRRELAERNKELKRGIVERDRLAAVARQCSESVFIIDPLGYIVYANPACEKNSGFSPGELVGMHLQEVRHVAKEDASVKEMMAHVDDGKEWRGNIYSLKKDGSIFLEEVAIFPVRAEGGTIKGHVVMKKDMTERRRLESIANSVNLMDNVGFVFSGIRHELGNPVNSLKMTLSVLSKKINEFSPETIADFLERSQHEISRIEYLLTSLRSFSMFEHPVCTDVDLVEFLNNLVDMHRKNLESSQVTIEVDVDVDVDAQKVFADSRVLLQVMLNLLSNGITALDGVDAPKLSIHVFRKSGNLVCLSLEDNGCGISEKNKEKLFKPFFTTRPEGTGLGLVIVKKMLAGMDCSIHVESVEQEGSTISILLPCGEKGETY